MTRTLTLIALITATAGCKDEELGCASNAACPPAHVCQSHKCEKLCSQDNDCSVGTYCDGTICVSGGRSAPEIESVTGNSPDTCTPPAAASGPCLGTGFVVIGSNLAGSSFRLEGPGGTVS